MATNQFGMYVPDEQIQNQLGHANKLRSMPIVPHWTGVLAQALGHGGAGFLTGDAFQAQDRNKATMSNVLRAAGQAPDNAAASQIMMDSGIPGMGEKGLGFLMGERSKVADREAHARMQRENFEFQKRLAMDLERERSQRMMEAVNGILAPQTATEAPPTEGAPTAAPAADGASAPALAPAMGAPAAPPGAQRISNQQAARLIMAGVPKEVVDLLRQNDGSVKVVGNKVLRIHGDGRTEVLFDNATRTGNPEIARNISGGLNRLAEIPNEFGGDSLTGGTFSSAVGSFQGDDRSWVMAPLTRTLGSIGSWLLREKGSPTEVRARIAGDTEALAAAIKPMIRAPGEGAWTDADQARLVSVVGDLATAANADEYRRRIEDVRQRVQSNFGLELPPIPGVTPGIAGQSPAAGQQAAQPETKVVNGVTYIKINGQWFAQ